LIFRNGIEGFFLEEVFEEDRLVVIVMIGPRESFYEKLKKRV
jgi:hypothetical protein